MSRSGSALLLQKHHEQSGHDAPVEGPQSSQTDLTKPPKSDKAELDALLQRLYNEGWAYARIAAHLGVSPGAVMTRASRLRRAGLLGRRLQSQHLAEELAGRLITLREQGRTAVAIAQALDMEPGVVEYHLRRLRQAGRTGAGEPHRKHPPVWTAARALTWPLTPKQLAAALYPDDPLGGQRARGALHYWLKQGRLIRRADGAYDLTEPAQPPHDSAAPTG